MKKTLHRIDERGVYEIPDYDYIKTNSPVDLNRCDSILLSGGIAPVPGQRDSVTLTRLEAITDMEPTSSSSQNSSNSSGNSTSDSEELIRPQTGVLDIESSRKIPNPKYVSIPISE